jgi:hypothetical protein
MSNCWVYLFSQPTIFDILLAYSKGIFLLQGLKYTCKTLYNIIPKYPYAPRSMLALSNCVETDNDEMLNIVAPYYESSEIYTAFISVLSVSIDIPNIIWKWKAIGTDECIWFIYKSVIYGNYISFVSACECFVKKGGKYNTLRKIIRGCVSGSMEKFDIRIIEYIFNILPEKYVWLECLWNLDIYVNDGPTFTFIMKRLNTYSDKVIFDALLELYIEGQTINDYIPDLTKYSEIYQIDISKLLKRLKMKSDYILKRLCEGET